LNLAGIKDAETEQNCLERALPAREAKIGPFRTKFSPNRLDVWLANQI